MAPPMPGRLCAVAVLLVAGTLKHTGSNHGFVGLGSPKKPEPTEFRAHGRPAQSQSAPARMTSADLQLASLPPCKATSRARPGLSCARNSKRSFSCNEFICMTCLFTMLAYSDCYFSTVLSVYGAGFMAELMRSSNISNISCYCGVWLWQNSPAKDAVFSVVRARAEAVSVSLLRRC